MTIARSLLVDRAGVGLYHCISRCVRRAFLCGDGCDHRKDWLRDRLMFLADVFSIDVAAYAIMSNHFHVVIRTDPSRAAAWSDLEIAQRWSRLCPRDVKVRTGTLTPEERRLSSRSEANDTLVVSEDAIRMLATDAKRIAVLRDRLSDLSWFMKFLKERIAKRANREDRCTGAFWEGRFKCHALLDDAAVLACMVYVDLNVIRAMLAATPEESDHTSVQDRIRVRQLYHTFRRRQTHVRRPGKSHQRDRKSKRAKSMAHRPSMPEDGIWLAPIEIGKEPARPGVLPMTLDQYLRVVDETARMSRADKSGAMAADLPPILQRLDIDCGSWQRAMRGLGRLFGTAVGSVSSRAAEAGRRGAKWVVAPLDVHASSSSSRN